MVISIRRFCALPCGVLFEATGLVSPKPLAEMLTGGAQLKAAGRKQQVSRLDIFLLCLQRRELRLELLVLGHGRIVLRLRDAARQN